MNKIVKLIVPGNFGGTEKVVITGAKQLSKSSNLSIWVISEKRSPHCAKNFINYLQSENLSYKEFECHSRFDRSLYLALKKELIKQDVSLIHAHGIKAIVYAYLLHKTTKFVATFHGQTSHTLLVKLYERLEILSLKKAKKVMVVSDQQKQFLKSKKIRGIELINNPLSLDYSKNTASSSGVKKILFIGRLSYEKGCDKLIKALPLLNLNYELTIIGDGIQRAYLENLVNKYELSTKVTFVGHKKDISPYLKEAHLQVITSRTEGMPMALIESASFGIPVVSTDVGDIRKVVEHKNNGIIVPIDNCEDLSLAINSLFSKYSFYKKNAYLKSYKVRQEYSTKNWALQTQRIYSEVLSV